MANTLDSKVILEIQPTDLLITLERVLEECSNSIFLGLSSVQNITEKPEKFLTAEDDYHSYPVFGSDYDLNTRKDIFKNWILKKGFEDLIRAATNGLVSVNYILDLKKELRNTKKNEEFVELIRNPDIQNKPTKHHFPKLLDNVKSSLISNLNYEDEIKSINNIRRCLVHRNGVVSEADTFGEKDISLHWITIQPIYTKDETGEVFELEKGKLLEGPGTFGVKFIKKSRVFKINESITISFKEFNELIWTVHLFGKDLISKIRL
ncbi:MAG: hypothetical protein WBB45_19415 [Cyclobacteriaceae bacterium]